MKLCLLTLFTIASVAVAEDTYPMLRDGKWHVHDRTRPQPPVVDPGEPGAQGKAPSDATILFDGKDLSAWKKSGGEEQAPWSIENGAMIAKGGDIETREAFGDSQIHLEWATPAPASGQDQGRGNSGVFIMGKYEIQVLDCYENVTYADGQAAAVYGQTPPLVNVCRPSGVWQTYDIIFTAPRFKEGKLEFPAHVTVLQNGVLVQNHTEILGSTRHGQVASYEPHDPEGPIRLQDHGNPTKFRNVWIRRLKTQEPEPPK